MMKKLLTVCGLMCALTVNAQDAYDVLRVMESDLNGTARLLVWAVRWVHWAETFP